MLAKFVSKRISNDKQRFPNQRHKHCSLDCPDHNSFANSLRKYPSNSHIKRSNTPSTANLTSNQRKSSVINQNHQSYTNNQKNRVSSAKYVRAFRQSHQPHQSLEDSFANIKINQKKDMGNKVIENSKQIEFYFVKEALKGKKKVNKFIPINKNPVKINNIETQNKFVTVEEAQYQRIKNNILRVSAIIDKMSEKMLGTNSPAKKIKSNQENINKPLNSELQEIYFNGKVSNSKMQQKKINLTEKTPSSNKSQLFGGAFQAKTCNKKQSSKKKGQICWRKFDILNYRMK